MPGGQSTAEYFPDALNFFTKKVYFIAGFLVTVLTVKSEILFESQRNTLSDTDGFMEEEIERLDRCTLPVREIIPDSVYDCKLKVTNRENFEKLPKLLAEKLPVSKNILIEIESGRYFSNTDHILLKNMCFPDSRLTIVGNGDVTVMATSGNLRDTEECSDGKRTVDLVNVDPEDVYTDGDGLIFLSGKDSDENEGVSFVENLFEKINPKDKQDLRYRLKSSLLPDMSAEECRNLWLWATHSWISSYEKIDSVTDGYIYLTANREVELYQCPLNTDYKSWKVMPRIKVINYRPSNEGVYVDSDGRISLPDGYEAIYKCDKGAFIRLENSNIKSLEVSGIKFVGGNAPIIDVNVVTDYAYIHDCEFTAQQSSAIRLRTDNGVVYNNEFRNSVANVIHIPDGGYRNHVIYNNRFTNCGMRLLNQPCVRVAADSVLVAQNTFLNNYISTVGVGVWHGYEPKGRIYTIVENNTILSDESFLKDYESNSLLDVSQLYVFTKNDEAIIRRNRIHGLRTLASGNGIYIDDGAYNVSVYDNIVTGIDGKLYNINCRKNISDKAKANAPAYSTNNFIANNIVDGPIRFEIRDDSSAIKYQESLYGGTFFLTKEGKSFNNKLENVNTTNDEILSVEYIDLIVGVTPETYDLIIRNSTTENIDFLKKWIRIVGKQY